MRKAGASCCSRQKLLLPMIYNLSLALVNAMLGLLLSIAKPTLAVLTNDNMIIESSRPWKPSLVTTGTSSLKSHIDPHKPPYRHTSFIKYIQQKWLAVVNFDPDYSDQRKIWFIQFLATTSHCSVMDLPVSRVFTWGAYCSCPNRASKQRQKKKRHSHSLQAAPILPL